MARKKEKKADIQPAKTSAKEVKRITLEDGAIIVIFDDGSIKIIPAPITLPPSVLEALGASSASEDEEEEDEEEEDDEEEDDEEEDEDDEDEDEEDKPTGDQLLKMDFEELEDVCSDHDLDTDPDDFDEDEIDKLRKAIAKEMGIALPKSKKK